MNFMDTQAIINMASQIQSIAEDMNRLNNVNLSNAADNIAAVWQGEAANAYLRHCATTRDHIRSTAGELLSLANELERAAREFETLQSEIKAKIIN